MTAISKLINTPRTDDIDTNTYISELWKRSNGEWKKFKSGDSNFSNPKFGDKENTIFYIKTNRTVQDKSKSKKTLSSIYMQAGRSVNKVFEIDGSISNYLLSADGKFIYVTTCLLYTSPSPRDQ